MDKYDEKFVPNSFGLVNTGSICYFNSMLQLVISCSSFTRKILELGEEMNKTLTGTELLKFVKMYTDVNSVDIGICSTNILNALKQDLIRKKSKIHFGIGQESASEALCLLIDVIDNKEIESLFLQRNLCIIQCLECKSKHQEIDTTIIYNYFHHSADSKDDSFVKNIRVQKSLTEDYRCNDCLCICGGKINNGFCSNCNKKAKKRKSIRVYYLTRIPEIFICTFNIYFDNKSKYYPLEMTFPSNNDNKLRYKLVGRVNHVGSSLNSGHYYADCVRKNGIYRLNDSSVSISRLNPNIEKTYILAYHYITN